MKSFAIAVTLAVCIWAFNADAAAFNPCTDGAGYIPLEQRYTTGVLFKIEKCNYPTSYVFGTIHLARKDIADISANAFKLIPHVKAAGFEIAESSEQILAEASPYMSAPPGEENRLSHLLGKDYYAKLTHELKFMAFSGARPVNMERLEHLKPWVVADVMLLVGQKRGMVLDEKLQIAAMFADIPIFGLESVDEQIQILSGLPDKTQIEMLKDIIDNYTDILVIQNKLIDAYVAKDGKKIQALEEESLVKDPDPAFEQMMQTRMIDDRNATMAKRLIPHMEKESVLLSVGFAHLLGPKGVLHLLEQQGYYITPMP